MFGLLNKNKTITKQNYQHQYYYIIFFHFCFSILSIFLKQFLYFVLQYYLLFTQNALGTNFLKDLYFHFHLFLSPLQELNIQILIELGKMYLFKKSHYIDVVSRDQNFLYIRFFFHKRNFN